jgi:hypothetical protein
MKDFKKRSCHVPLLQAFIMAQACSIKKSELPKKGSVNEYETTGVPNLISMLAYEIQTKTIGLKGVIEEENETPAGDSPSIANNQRLEPATV